ncbi:MAG: hypothetical protein ABDH37_00105 [Candidatus Hydrothermales bacterium]
MILKERFQNLAFKYYNQREFDRALVLVDRYLEEDKDNYNLLLFKGDILFEKEEIESAQSYYISALEKANKEKNHMKRLLALMKLKKLQGETNELNSRIFISAYNLEILKLCKDALNKLLREELLEDSKRYLERIIREIFGNQSVQQFLIGILNLYLKNEEGIKLIKNAYDNVESDNKLKNYKEFIEGLLKAKKRVDLKELEDILNIEGLSEKKLEPSGTLELADLLRSIGSIEEAILEYYSAIYGYLKSESNIDKAREILNKIRDVSPEENRIEKVEEFLQRFESGSKEEHIKIEINHDLLVKIFNDFLLPENNFENYLNFINLMAEWNMHDEVIDDYRSLEENTSVDLFVPYYLYTLYKIGEYEEIITKSDKFIELTEREETMNFIRYFKGLSLYNLNSKKEALEIFGSIYEKDPGFLDVKEYIEIKRPEEALIKEKITEEIKEIEEVVPIYEPAAIKDKDEGELGLEEVVDVYTEEKSFKEPYYEEVRSSKQNVKDYFIII